jgi:hypothetical protein
MKKSKLLFLIMFLLLSYTALGQWVSEEVVSSIYMNKIPDNPISFDSGGNIHMIYIQQISNYPQPLTNELWYRQKRKKR